MFSSRRATAAVILTHQNIQMVFLFLFWMQTQQFYAWAAVLCVRWVQKRCRCTARRAARRSYTLRLPSSCTCSMLPDGLIEEKRAKQLHLATFHVFHVCVGVVGLLKASYKHIYSPPTRTDWMWLVMRRCRCHSPGGGHDVPWCHHWCFLEWQERGKTFYVAKVPLKWFHNRFHP